MRGSPACRRVGAAALTVLAVTLAGAAVSAAAIAGSHGAACTGPLVVTNGRDANPRPPAGSLRYVLDHAHRNDTVTFCASTLVQLVAPLDVVSGEDGVTVIGGHIAGVGSEGLVRVSADRVRFVHDAFDVRMSITGADDVVLRDDQFSVPGGNPGTSQAVIEVSRAMGLTLDHVQVSATHDRGLGVQGSSAVTVAGNSTFTVMHHIAIDVARYPLSAALTIRDTTSDGAFVLAPFSGEVIHNTITEGSGGAGIVVAVPNDGHLASYGTLTISDNTLNTAAIAATRSNLVLSGNVVSQGPGIGVRCDPSVARGTVALTANRSMGTRVGLAYSCNTASTTATSTRNTATQNRVVGFRFGASKLSSDLDSATGGSGSGFQLAANSGPVSLTGDTATTNAGDGVIAGRGARAAVSGGVIQSNGKAGVAEGAGARLKLSRVAMGENAGPGIVGSGLAPPALKYRGHAIFGTTCAGCVVEAFTIESGTRAGNPTNGEGAAFVRELRAGSDGRFVERVSCAVAKTLTFTATGGGSEPETSGFSQDVSCSPPLLHVFARITYAGVTCNTVADGTTVTVTDPTTTTPVDYYSYFTVPRNCADPTVYAFGTMAWVALNADSENQEKTPDVESTAEDGRELALPDPAFPPDTTLYATHVEVCSTTGSGLQSSGLILYMDPQNPACSVTERVLIEVINHQPGP